MDLEASSLWPVRRLGRGARRWRFDTEHRASICSPDCVKSWGKKRASPPLPRPPPASPFRLHRAGKTGERKQEDLAWITARGYKRGGDLPVSSCFSFSTNTARYCGICFSFCLSTCVIVCPFPPRYGIERSLAVSAWLRELCVCVCCWKEKVLVGLGQTFNEIPPERKKRIPPSLPPHSTAM